MPELSCILLAGPNGSGKTSAFAKLQLEGVWINADEIAKAMPAADDRSTDIQAGRAALLKIAEMIATRQSFIFETTLSSNQSLRMMRDAKAAGFTVGLYYVALDSVETNVERVRQRVLKGGHDIPEENIRRRHEGSFEKLTEALRIADEVLLIDNSGIEPHEVFAISGGAVQSFDIDDSQPLHKLFEAKVCEAYGLVKMVDGFRTADSAAQDVEDLTARILRTAPGYKPDRSNDK